MRRLIGFALFALMLSFACIACAQTVAMESAHMTMEYPDSWLVVSPQLARVYAPLLAEAGIDGEELSKELEKQGVLSRAYNADYTQSRSVLIREDDAAFEIYDIASVTDEQRKTIRRRAENGSLFETTGMRVQDIEWQKENGLYWLYVHYTKYHGEQMVGRGVRYISIFNGNFVMLDWFKTKDRFSNRDLNTFRSQISDLSVTKVAAPLRAVRLTAEIPTETNTSGFEITGQTTGGATLVAEAPDKNGTMQMLSVGVAKDNGSFALLVELPEEGTYDVTLTAQKDGMLDNQLEGQIFYSAKTLPVSGIEEKMTTTSNETVLKGETLAGVQIQLVTPFGLSKKRSGNDGSFKFELTTKDAGDYDYTLILDKAGFDQRRIRFTITREMTDQQEKSRIKEGSEAISYKNLQKDLSENRGKTMTIRGPVAEISSGGGMYYVRMYYNKDAKGNWYNPVVIVAKEDMGVKVNEMMTAVVTVGGVYEEQNSMGETVIIPKLDLVFVDKIE